MVLSLMNGMFGIGNRSGPSGGLSLSKVVHVARGKVGEGFCGVARSFGPMKDNRHNQARSGRWNRPADSLISDGSLNWKPR